MKSLIFVFVIAMLSGCSHFHRVVEPKPTEAAPEGVTVRIGAKEVQPGDIVTVFKTTCKTPSTTRGNAPQKCTRQTIGRAKVIQVLEKNLAIISPLEGIIIDESMNVEKE